MKATKKRQFLKEYLEEYCRSFNSNYRFENRVRRATMGVFSRSQRISVMGAETTYGEVLSGVLTPEHSQYDAVTNPELQSHGFVVNIWYGYKDSDRYEHSSQKVWDEMIHDGLLIDIQELNYQSYREESVYVFEPTNITDIIVPLDSEGKELSHFLSFSIILR